ncbi:MAG TPA: hypothetical protein VFQ88_02925 [Nevskiaceae bacterium]|nr:hypothetical protein [Nevskiaceae bacterium]
MYQQHVFDEQDQALLQRRQDGLNARSRIGVGDFLRFPDGSFRRVAHDWGDSVQPTVGGSHPCVGDESFYLDAEGGASFSGSLGQALPVTNIAATNETRDGTVWFFHHNYPCAGGGVHASARFRVFKVRLFTDADVAYIERNHPSRKDLAEAARYQDASGFLDAAGAYTQSLDIRISDLCDRLRGLHLGSVPKA